MELTLKIQESTAQIQTPQSAIDYPIFTHF